jgi:hypothetical protein
MSGMLAGHMVVQITIVGVPDTNLIAEYQRFLHTTFEFDLRQTSKKPHFA